MSRRLLMVSVVFLELLLVWRPTILQAAEDPLPTWNDVESKRAIVAFVTKVTNEGDPDFLPIAKRIAVFDNDGTLWCEQPMYAQLAFALDRVKALAEKHPEWRTTQPYQSVLEDNLAALALVGEKAIGDMVAATHSGMTTDEFSEIVSEWLAKARHPEHGRLYTECVYQPMLELMQYLRENGFTTYIVSGGGVDFVRVFAEKVYGIPAHQVIGSTIKTKYEVRDGVPVLLRLPEIDFVSDKEGKPIAIHRKIGAKPVMAFGNSDGDFEMLEYTTSGSGAHFGLIVHHTDGVRESSYDSYSLFGRLDKGLKEAPKRGWTVVDMKRDWKQIFIPRSK